VVVVAHQRRKDDLVAVAHQRIPNLRDTEALGRARADGEDDDRVVVEVEARIHPDLLRQALPPFPDAAVEEARIPTNLIRTEGTERSDAAAGDEEDTERVWDGGALREDAETRSGCFEEVRDDRSQWKKNLPSSRRLPLLHRLLRLLLLYQEYYHLGHDVLVSIWLAFHYHYYQHHHQQMRHYHHQ